MSKRRTTDLENTPVTPEPVAGMSATVESVAPAVPARPARTLWGDAVRRLRKNKLAIAGLIWIVIIVALVVSADLWVPHFFAEPTSTEFASLQSPSAEHPFGTDRIGRDVFSRVIYGGRVSLAVGVLATSISLVIGLFMGSMAGYYGGIVDSLVMRTADIFFAFPYTLFAIVLLAVLGPSFWNVFIAIGILGWPSTARVLRSSILSVKQNEYVEAAHAMGASNMRVLGRHIMPNAIAPIIVYATMSVGGAILSEAALSYLGMGVQPPMPSWGQMLSEAKSLMVAAPWLTIYPGFAILTTVFSFVLIGDGLRDALDVKMKD